LNAEQTFSSTARAPVKAVKQRNYSNGAHWRFISIKGFV